MICDGPMGPSFYWAIFVVGAAITVALPGVIGRGGPLGRQGYCIVGDLAGRPYSFPWCSADSGSVVPPFPSFHAPAVTPPCRPAFR
jgi:hypothetical protein